MSGPFRFQADNTRSPLDRTNPGVFPTGSAPNFKTNVNRMKTKKWVQAKKNAYDGDDWGDYDEFDEYGVETPPPEPAGPAGYQHQGHGYDNQVRSFTDPSQRQAGPALGRRNSFEAGEEHRAFSASMKAPAQGGPHDSEYSQPPPANPPHDASAGPLRHPSAAESDVSDTPQHRRDFSPSAMPPPLHTRGSPAPASATASPFPQFPPRKSSIGSSDSPIQNPRDRAPSNPTKPLPFIRPADIYKRVEEERQRERASLDSSRPSLDSLSSRPREDITSPIVSKEPGASGSAGFGNGAARNLHPLETVAERKSEFISDGQAGLPPTENSASSTRGPPQISPTSSLPQVSGISAFDNDFWSSSPQVQIPPVGNTAPVAQAGDPNLRSVVDQAFTRSDDQRSVPPTPISKDSDSVSRSNTNSTSGISPIMSRVPSSATSALKNRANAGIDNSTPVITEEASEQNTPISQPTSAAALGGPYHVPRKPSPIHSRNVSSTSLSRSNLATPSPGESPARSPAIEPQKILPEPESAALGTLNSNSPENAATYATREADIASALRMSPDKAVSELGAAEKDSQAAFLESHHNTQVPLQDAVPRSRSESPSKGRVQELAGRFGDVSHSRRGSVQSNGSRNSIQSWERSRDNSQPPSPTKAESAVERPAAAREASFRPKLPGQWESYATNVPTPPEQTEPHKEIVSEPRQEPLDEVDITPTTAKHPVSGSAPAEPASDPLAALKAAGAAMGEALQASVGLGGSSKESQPEEHQEQLRDRSHGNVYMNRPVQLDRTTSAVSDLSSIPPTPPEKDIKEHEDLPPPPPLKETSPEPSSPPSQQQTPVRPMMLPQLSTDPADDDQESDRLRKEIVASLSPLRTSETVGSDTNRGSLVPAVPGANRDSSILPSEYDSYWADDDNHSAQPSHDIAQNVSEPSQSNAGASSPKNRLSGTQPAGPPSLLTRFSWEDHNAQLLSSDTPERAAGPVPPMKDTPEEPKSASSAGKRYSQSSGGFPTQYFGPSHIAAAKPEPINDPDIKIRSPTPPPPSSANPVESPTQAEIERSISPASGLHVVNSDLNPEAVDLPPRLSAETSLPSGPSKISAEEPSAVQPDTSLGHMGAIVPVDAANAPAPVPESPAKVSSPLTDKPLGFKEIMNIKSSTERIATYNKTRDYWATADHGLSDWITSAMAAKPELASQAPAQPQLVHSHTSRHRPTGSISLFGKHSAAGSAPPQAPGTPAASGSGAEARPYGPGSAGPGARSASQQMNQMQAKGKDFLHTAGKMSGKGMTQAKGLFAKGKSRFRASGSGGGDKVDK